MLLLMWWVALHFKQRKRGIKRDHLLLLLLKTADGDGAFFGVNTLLTIGW